MSQGAVRVCETLCRHGNGVQVGVAMAEWDVDYAEMAHAIRVWEILGQPTAAHEPAARQRHLSLVSGF